MVALLNCWALVMMVIIVIIDPVSVADALRVVVFRITRMGVLERRMGEREHKARDHPEMKALPHQT